MISMKSFSAKSVSTVFQWNFHISICKFINRFIAHSQDTEVSVRMKIDGDSIMNTDCGIDYGIIDYEINYGTT